MFTYDSLEIVYTNDRGDIVKNYRLTWLDGSTMLFNTYNEAVLYSNNPVRITEQYKITNS